MLPKLALPPDIAVKRKPGQSMAVLIGTRALFSETLNIVARASSLDDLNDEPLKSAMALNLKNMTRNGFVKGFKEFAEAKGDKIFRGDLRTVKLVYDLDARSLAAALDVSATVLHRWLAVRKSDLDVLPLTWQKLTAAVLQLVKDRIQTDKYSEDEILKRFKIFIDKDSRKYFS
jgi:hypothetical protein